eukprot:CAMPEP_0178380748 /NCGR_PEP_ID=MMETSP0689_2-20121128/5625_1 /TAXON_ID=160604 /ORGANISM="Amphidinium massartii, Strain CS-259" /LENGTH=549 /DNA_ID=CAMNT_0020000905 /DNA_START=124 /DNA_END=1771 /DNA_ORIENTATION=-
MAGLIRATRDAEETRFLVRTFACHIRTQATLTTVKDAAVAAIMTYRSKNGLESGTAVPIAEVQLAAREQFTACPDVEKLLEPLLHGGLEAMRKATSFSVGIPMRPMLAKAETSVDRIISLNGSAAFACEHKYDGQRAQIHRSASGLCTIFSRHLEDMTSKFPDVVEAMTRQCLTADGQPRNFVLDAEIVAVAPPAGHRDVDGALADEADEEWRLSGTEKDAFQRLSTRKRKDVTVGSIEVNVKVFAFDLLFIDADRIITRSFRERRSLLHGNFAVDESFAFAEFTDIAAEGEKQADVMDVEEESSSERHAKVQEALERSLVAKCEGLMCKALDASYEPSDGSKRSSSWLKLKADYIEGMGDSLDLVPIGGWQGMGRKSKWISPFLLACWDPDTESLQSVCRVLSGFTDAFYKEKTAYYIGSICDGVDAGDDDEDDATTRPPGYRSRPDPRVLTEDPAPMWFNPCEVWEVKGASISLSPKHKAGVGMVHAERGLSLRFPRFIRLRPDKSVEEATTSHALVELFRKQQANEGGKPGQTKAAMEDASDVEND